jgi:hypothetical protein
MDQRRECYHYLELPADIEQVRKGGLPPLAQQRGQAPLPDLLPFLSCSIPQAKGLQGPAEYKYVVR